MINQQKKPTKAEMERRMNNAIVLVPKDKDTKSIYFDDKALRLTVTSDFAVVATMFHQHVFNALTASGVSRPYLYTKNFIEIVLAQGDEIMVKDARGNRVRSYARLFSVLEAKEDKNEYNLAWYYDLWLNNIFNPLYGIGESESEAFLVYEQYLHNVARNHLILSEKPEGMTNIRFVNETMELVKKYIDGVPEIEIFEPMTDEERAKAEIDALNEEQQQKFMEEQANATK